MNEWQKVDQAREYAKKAFRNKFRPFDSVLSLFFYRWCLKLENLLHKSILTTHKKKKILKLRGFARICADLRGFAHLGIYRYFKKQFGHKV